MTEQSPGPPRILVVMPSWVGDAVMATPALDRLRAAMPGAFIGALVRPGIDRLLTGSFADNTSAASASAPASAWFDELHIIRPTGVLGPKHAAAKLRPRRYHTAVLMTNSFSTALITRIAGIRRRIGYDRDGRGFLLTDRLKAPKTDSGEWAIVPAVDYYAALVRTLLNPDAPREVLAPPLTDARSVPLKLAPHERLRLPIDDADRELAERLIDAGAGGKPFAVLNPGGNNPAKRWPAQRFAELARWLNEARGLAVLINGAPTEADLIESIVTNAPAAASLPTLGGTLGALRHLLARASLLVTNDTGPRHIAAAVGCPIVSLFGPTDPRWTTIPTRLVPGFGETANASGTPSRFPDAPAEAIVLADPDLPPDRSANEDPERCRVDRIPSEVVRNAVDAVLDG